MKSLIFLFIAIFQMTLSHASPINARQLFTSPDNGMVKVSPSGKFISAHQKADKTHYLSLINTSTLTTEFGIAIGNDNILNNYYWLNEKKLFIDITYKGVQVYLIGEIKKDKIKTNIVEARGYLVNTLPDAPNKVMFARKKSKKSNSHDLYEIDLDSLIKGDFTKAFLIKHNENKVINYEYDHNYKRVITANYDEEAKSITVKYIPRNGGRWRKIIELEDTDFNLKPLDFITKDSIAVLTNKDSDKMVLRAFDINSQTLGKVIYQHPKYDITSAGFIRNGQLDYITYKQHGLNQKLYFEKAKSHFGKRLNKTFSEQEAYIIDKTDNNIGMILYANGSAESGKYYYYDTSLDQAKYILPSFDEHQSLSFIPSEQLVIKTKDGTELEAFLTLPKGLDHLTLLVMPHGGPIGIQESDRFNPYVQYYASRGFAVLRVNFRGSSGFGKSFLNKGVGELGKLIEQDITSAVNQVTKAHKFKYQCAMGASYGGYSSTMLAIKQPDKVNCVIASFGIYDLPLLFNTSNYRSGDEHSKKVAEVVGSYDESLINVSPVYLADKLKSPILIIAGRDDDIADFEHSNRLKYVLNQLDNKPETMFYDNTGHGHHNWSGDRHEAALSYDFLMRSLGLSLTKEQLSEQGKKAIAEDYIVIADAYKFKDNVVNDAKKSIDYYNFAVQFEHPRATFNIGDNYHWGRHVERDLPTAMSYYKKSAMLDYSYAYSRIGVMNMEGEYIKQNWESAFENLSKAQELKDSLINSIRLGRFYCTAPEKYQNLDKCLNLMDLAQYKKISNRKYIQAKEYVSEALAWSFITAKLDEDQLDRIKYFAKDSFELSSIAISVENEASGQFEFQESDDFGYPGEYKLVKNKKRNKIIKRNEKSRFGLKFNVDIPGINPRNTKVALAAQWIKTTKDGKTFYPETTLLYGSTRADWSMLRAPGDKNEEAIWTLKLYDLNQNLLFMENYQVSSNSIAN